MANFLTGIRIICGLLILAFPAFSGWYYAFYILGGLTDAIDGTVARKQGKATEFGAKFDTIADAIFLIAIIVKFASFVVFPLWLMIWIGVIVMIKVVNIGIGYIKFNTIVTVHSLLNKICGIIIFATPLFVGINFAWKTKDYVIIFACTFATVSALFESYAIINSKKET